MIAEYQTKTIACSCCKGSGKREINIYKPPEGCETCGAKLSDSPGWLGGWETGDWVLFELKERRYVMSLKPALGLNRMTGVCPKCIKLILDEIVMLLGATCFD